MEKQLFKCEVCGRNVNEEMYHIDDLEVCQACWEHEVLTDMDRESLE